MGGVRGACRQQGIAGEVAITRKERASRFAVAVVAMAIAGDALAIFSAFDPFPSSI